MSEKYKERFVYRIRSRNLVVGVFDGDSGFIGIREKFGSRFLFKEYVGDGGTVSVVGPAFGRVPDRIPLRERQEGSWCLDCHGKAWWTGPPAPAPWACENDCENVTGYGKGNQELFDLLEAMEALPSGWDQ